MPPSSGGQAGIFAVVNSVILCNSIDPLNNLFYHEVIKIKVKRN